MDIGLSLSRNARRLPNKTAYIYKDKSYTYDQMNKEVNKLAHGLIGHGVKKGDKVAFMMENSDKFVMVYYAIMKIGAIAVPVNFRLTAREVAYIVNDCDAGTVLFDGKFAELIANAVAENKKVKLKISTDESASNGQFTINKILTDNETDPSIIVNEDDDAQILYTSGTTGNPKGALFDHHRILHVAFNTSIMMSITPSDNLLHVAPLFHSAQLNLFLISGTYLGCKQVIHQSFDPTKVLEDIEKHKISIFFAVPTMYNFLLQVPNKYDLSSVTRCGYGAAPMPIALLKQVMELFQMEQFYNMCGLTEAGPGGVMLTPEDHDDKIGAGGKAMLNTEARVVNESGEDVHPGQVGEFVLKGETIMKYYYNKPEETSKTLKDDWLYTGDLATIDEEGFITLVDRRKDMIISGGENVYSTEVEHVLYQHPDLLECAVIGLPDETWGEKVVAVVVPKEGKSIDEEQLKEFCRDYLAKYKIPVEFKFEKEIPRNASGKVLKYRLRESLTKETT
ncbi:MULTISPECIES: long-chain fatty acid--CoA ligase [Allobacillus]|uniref:Long-chain fatty acid--CoA ligase n=1 Tax=Allobacillus salarius TaxID=1955272 RepID=A0A556PLG5_9BACI|nr:long-chain fatty acid--CoA ligase [Allobacillus salarius]TSJ65231.1 long-chain fatty acid--CoA ligase [Allobacillus salarius]